MNKKLITILIALSITGSLIGCSNSKQNNVVESNTSNTQTAAITSEVLSNINLS